ncbi:hypothetical protein AAFN86_15530 [Roseomonas sp. CAU 1739]|uniref:hypothetical protein n=1 Tax=Roseomonas sp. CAU 1739 TaxID=3140364 RepID=UPI00325B3EA0
MAWSIDARIPVRLLHPDEMPPAGAALLTEGDAPAPPGTTAWAAFTATVPGHAPGCACCQPRTPVAAALDRLFTLRVRQQVPWFTEVVARIETQAGQAALDAALAADVLAVARFRRA